MKTRKKTRKATGARKTMTKQLKYEVDVEGTVTRVARYVGTALVMATSEYRYYLNDEGDLND